MGTSAPALSLDELENFRTALSSLALFERAGVPLKFWEAYSFACKEAALFNRERRRLGDTKPEVSGEFLEKLRVLRNNLGSLVARLRRMVSLAVLKSQNSEHQELILGLIVTSPPGRAAAFRWVAEPSRFEREAFEKIRLLEEVVEAHQLALRAVLLAPEESTDRPDSPSVVINRMLVQPAAAPSPPESGATEPPKRDAAPALAETADFSIPKNVRRSALPPGTHVDIPSTTEVLHPEKVETKPPPAPPPSPKNLSAAADKTECVLKWEAGGGGETYNLKRATGSGGPYSTIASGLSQASFVDMDMVPGTTYFYVVSATNGGGEGPNSAEVSQVAPPPEIGRASCRERV